MLLARAEGMHYFTPEGRPVLRSRPQAPLPQTISGYRAGEALVIGPFRITPYLMDHSAYDAHALLVEADQRRREAVS